MYAHEAARPNFLTVPYFTKVHALRRKKGGADDVYLNNYYIRALVTTPPCASESPGELWIQCGSLSKFLVNCELSPSAKALSHLH